MIAEKGTLSEEEQYENEAIQARVDAEIEANLRELLGSPVSQREEVKTEAALAHFERLHATSHLRPTREVLAAIDDLRAKLSKAGAVFESRRAGHVIKGVVDALIGSVDPEQGGPTLRPPQEIIESLALMEADKIRVEAGIEAKRISEVIFPWSYLDGSIIAYEWVLGRRETLDHTSDPKPTEAQLPSALIESPSSASRSETRE